MSSLTTLISCIVILFPGSFSSILENKCLSCLEGWCRAGCVKGSVSTLRCSSAAVLPIQGTRPVTIAYRVTPSDQMSAAWKSGIGIL